MTGLAKNATWVAIGQGLSVVVQASYFLLVARLLGPAEFGRYATVVALVAVVSQYANLGSGYVLLRYGSIREQDIPVFWGNVLLSLGTFALPVVAAICAFAFYNTHTTSLELVVTVALSDCVLQCLVNAAAQAFQSRERMLTSAALTLSANAARLITAALLLFLYERADSLVWARSVLLCSSLVALIAFACVTKSFGWPKFRPPLLWKHAGEGLSFSVSLSTTALYNDLDKILLGHYGFYSAAATYTAAYRVLNAANMPAYAIYSSAYPRFFRAGAQGFDAAVKLSRKLVLRTTPLTLLVSLGIFFTAPYAAAAFGPDFGDTARALRWLCFLPLFRSVQWSAGDALSGLGRQHIRLGLQGVAVIINLSLNLMLIPRHSWLGAAWATLVTDGSLAIMCWIALGILPHSNSLRKPQGTQLDAVGQTPDQL